MSENDVKQQKRSNVSVSVLRFESSAGAGSTLARGNVANGGQPASRATAVGSAVSYASGIPVGMIMGFPLDAT